MRREMEREEEEEVEEVEGTINDLIEEEEMEEQEQEDINPLEVDENTEPQPPAPRVSGWRKSIEVVKGGLGWALGSPSVPRDVQGEWDKEDEQEQEEEAMEEVCILGNGIHLRIDLMTY